MPKKGYYQENREKCRTYAREWYRNLPEERRREYQRVGKEWRRLHILTTAGGVSHSGLNKRPRPDDICELCGREVKRLSYHHWDDTNLSKGLWVCYLCHMLCENLDNGSKSLIKVYEVLKFCLDETFKERLRDKEETNDG